MTKWRPGIDLGLSLALALLALGIGSVCSGARADLYDIPKSQTVMKKNYSLGNEVSLEFGYLPVDPLSKYLTGGVSYTQKFNENHGWEIFNVIYTLELATSLKRQMVRPLPDGYGLDQNSLPVLSLLMSSNYLFSPLYTKSILFNKSMIYSQMSFVAGGGVAKIQSGIVPLFDVGLIERFFLARSQSVKFDFRYLAFSTNNELLKNNISLVVAYSWSFGE